MCNLNMQRKGNKKLEKTGSVKKSKGQLGKVRESQGKLGKVGQFKEPKAAPPSW